jgi:Nif-specific regulatory protein
MSLHIRSQRFDSLKKISASDFSSVFRAVDTVGRHEVALKVAAGTSGPHRDALLKEFSFLSRCNHPNIIEVHDLSDARTATPFFTMKWIEGCTLSSAGQMYGAGAIVEAIPSLCHALAEVHDMGYVYGDLHPSNVLLGKCNGGIATTLIDFGLVSRIGAMNPRELWGMPEYMPPEVRRGDPVRPASDVYSFGILLQKLLWGDAQLMPPAASSPLNSKMLRELIDRCVEYYPEYRPQDFHEVGRMWSRQVITPQGKTGRQVMVGKSQRWAIGQHIHLAQMEELAGDLFAHGGGVLSVSGFGGAGKTTLVDRYRRKLQNQGYRTIRIVCDNLHQDSARIFEAVREAAGSRAAGQDHGLDSAELYFFLTVHDGIDLQSVDFDLLLSAVRSLHIVCIIESPSAADMQPVAGIRSVQVNPLTRDDFDRLCEALFKHTPAISATTGFLYSASGGLPGVLTQKYREYSAYLQQCNESDEFNWRRMPQEAAEEWMRVLSDLPAEGRRVAQAVAVLLPPFTAKHIAAMAGMGEETARTWMAEFINIGFIRAAGNQDQPAYDTFSIWVDDAIRTFAAATGASQGAIPADGDDRSSRGPLPLRQALLDPAGLLGMDRLPATHHDLRCLPYMARICRQLIHGGLPWGGVTAHLRRTIFKSVIANYESVAAHKQANCWARRLATLELHSTSPDRPPLPADISEALQLLNRHCTARETVAWLDNLCQRCPQLVHDVQALLLSERGVVELRHNHLDRALQYFFEAEAVYNQDDYRDHRRARNLSRIGVIFHNRKNYPVALKYYEAAKDMLREHPDVDVAAAVEMNIGILLTAVGQARKGFSYFKSALAYAKRTHDLRMLGFVARNMVVVIGDLEPAPEAVRVAEEALSTLHNTVERADDAIVYFNLGWAHLRAGNGRTAYANIMRGINLSRRTSNSRWLGVNYLNLARLFSLQGDLRKAISFALKSLVEARRQHSRDAAAEACRVIALLLTQAGDHVRAGRYLSHALQRRTPGENQRSDFFTDMTEAEILLHHGKLPEVQALLDRWSNSAVDVLPGWVCLLHRLYGLLHLAAGRQGEGINELRDAGCRARLLGRYDLLIPIYQDILRAYAKSANSRAALPYAHELRRIYRKVGRMANDEMLKTVIRELTEKSDDRRFAEMVLRLSESLTKFSDKHKLLDFLLQAAVDYFGADRGALISRHPSSKGLFIEAQCGLQSGIDEDDTLEISRSVIRRVSRTSQFIKIDNAPEDPLTRTKKSILQHNILAVMCVPIFHNNEIWGVLYLDNRSVPEAFKGSDSKMLQALANFMTLAIEQSDEISRLRLRESETITMRDGILKFVADSPKMVEVLDTADRIADSDVPVLILGENGTGKDVLAAYIHRKSSRSPQPFISMNCAGLVPTLADTELFGIEDKVASGVEFREGKFKLADGGTLFLNEIGDLALPVQAKLLTALTDGMIERVGGRPMGVDVRFITATNKDLEKMVEAESFRLDLYFRINTIKITIPPLRERVEDIPRLARIFLEHFCVKYGRARLKMSDAVLEELCLYSWPGNIRELKGMIQRGVLLAQTDRFPEGITTPSSTTQKALVLKKRNLHQVLEEKERQMVIEALESEAYNQSKAADRLGIVESTLRTKMSKLGIKKPRRL